MKKYFIIILLLSSFSLSAQDYYKELLEQLPSLTPHEALYNLTDYQAFMPTNHNGYYQLGKINYELKKAEHPIRDYNELSLCLYNAKLYFGNCLYYAKGQSLKSSQYADVPYDGKKLTYEDLERYLNNKIKEVANITANVDRLYNSYYTLVNRYEDCRSLFNTFSEKYVSEKNAHLLLDADDEILLHKLQNKSDSIASDVQRFQEALSAFPIDRYNPQFTQVSIDLYRLDGLTTTDFLQNKVSLWDYSSWVRNFLDKQKTVYSQFYADLLSAHRINCNTILGLNDNYDKDEILLNRIDRLDYESFMIPFFSIESIVAQSAADARKIINSKSEDIETYSDNLLSCYQIAQRRNELVRQNSEFETRYATEETLKYMPFFNKYYQQTLKPDCNVLISQYDSILLAAENYLMTQSNGLVNVVHNLHNDITGETVNATYNNQVLRIIRKGANKKTLASVEIPMIGSLIALVAVDGNYLAILNYERIYDREAPNAGEIASVLISQEGDIMKSNYYQSSLLRHASGVVKLTSNNIAIITDDSTHEPILFVDNKGNLKL